MHTSNVLRLDADADMVNNDVEQAFSELRRSLERAAAYVARHVEGNTFNVYRVSHIVAEANKLSTMERNVLGVVSSAY
jgi:hypothetical protein